MSAAVHAGAPQRARSGGFASAAASAARAVRKPSKTSPGRARGSSADASDSSETYTFEPQRSARAMSARSSLLSASLSNMPSRPGGALTEMRSIAAPTAAAAP
jgi:hypothetical protein